MASGPEELQEDKVRLKVAATDEAAGETAVTEPGSTGDNADATVKPGAVGSTEENQSARQGESAGAAENEDDTSDEEGAVGPAAREGDLVGDHYRIEALVGKGGMSTVYRARHMLIDRPVALKVMNDGRAADPKAVQRFQQEARVISQLDHANIVRLLEFGVDNEDRPYLVMDLVEGESLDQYIQRKGKLGPKEALEIAVDVAEALQHAHEKGVVHRDLKPSNIVLEKTSSGRLRAKVVDFGIAKLASNSDSQKLTQTGDTFGSPTYMSPEQCLGKEIGPRSDIYSLACVIVEMLTGRPLFEADMPIQVLAKHLNEKPQRLSSMKALREDRLQWTVQEATMMSALDRVLAKALNKSAEDRYRNAGDFASDLLTVLKDPASLAKNLPLYVSHLERKSIFGQASYMVAGVIVCIGVYLAATQASNIWHTYDNTVTTPMWKRLNPEPEAPPEPLLALPQVPVLQPTTFKPAAVMSDPLFVFDGLPAMHAQSDSLRAETRDLQSRQQKGWATTRDQVQLARDSLNLGRIMVDSGNPRASINEFSRVIGLQQAPVDKAPDFSLDNELLLGGYLGLGDARLSMGNYAEALKAYESAMRFYRDGEVFDDKLKQGLILQRIAFCYLGLGDKQSLKMADQTFKHALDHLLIKDPQSATDRTIIAAAASGDVYLHQRQYQKALEQFEQALAAADNLPGAYASANAAQEAFLNCRKALCLGLMGQIEESNRFFDLALAGLDASRPNETYMQDLLKPRIAFARALILQKHGQSEKALELLRTALSMTSGSDRDSLGLRLAILEFAQGLQDAKFLPGELKSWLEELAQLKKQGASNSILPGPAITQTSTDQIFSE